MKIIRIPKRRPGEYRKIYWPNTSTEVEHFRRLLPPLERICEDKLRDCVHGFRPHRSPVTNAKPHIGYAFTVTFDLEDFFDSVTVVQLRGVLHERWLKDVMVAVTDMPGSKKSTLRENAILAHGSPRQGLPTSPLVANLAAAAMDREILELVGDGGVYTRYADDLSISTNDEALVALVTHEVRAIVVRHCLRLNPRKTHVLRASAGRRIITGVAVDDDGIYPTRRLKRRLRAARHHVAVGRHRNQARRSARGLEEWMRLREPSGLGRNHEKWKRELEKELGVQ